MDVGVIGVGAMGKNHARVYSELKAVDNLHLFDLDTRALKEMGKRLDAHVASSMDELPDSCEAVSICVPTPYHYKVAEEVIDHRRCSNYRKANLPNFRRRQQHSMRRIPEDLTVRCRVTLSGSMQSSRKLAGGSSAHPCYVGDKPSQSRLYGPEAWLSRT